MRGRIFDLSRLCYRDGPGVRTTVFFKGCPLHCRWCHNPEGLSMRPHAMATPARCIGCGACVAQCPQGCHTLTEQSHTLDAARCTGCGACAAVCPAKALRMAGREEEAEALADRIARDKPYFRYGGGATLSGGEVLMQPGFALALLAALRTRELHTCVETSGCRADGEALAVLAAADMVLLDCKHTDAAALKHWTGLNMTTWRACLDFLEAQQKPVILRCPIIPGVNLAATHAEKIGELAENCRCITQVELLPYHSLGEGKRAALAMQPDVFRVPKGEEMQAFAAAVRCRTGKPVHW